MWGGSNEDEARLFSVLPSDKTRGNGHELKDRKVHFSRGKNLFIVKVVKYLNRLPGEVVESLSGRY